MNGHFIYWFLVEMKRGMLDGDVRARSLAFNKAVGIDERPR